MRSYDATFVGTGFGRVAGASMTARTGKNVPVVDKDDMPGRYAITLRRKDFDFDVSLHSFGGTVKGANHLKVLKDRAAATRVMVLPNKCPYRSRSDDSDLKLCHRYLEGHTDGHEEQLFYIFRDEVDNINWLFAGPHKNYQDARGFLYYCEPFRPGLAETPFGCPRSSKYGHETADQYFSRLTTRGPMMAVVSARVRRPTDRQRHEQNCRPDGSGQNTRGRQTGHDNEIHKRSDRRDLRRAACTKVSDQRPVSGWRLDFPRHGIFGTMHGVRVPVHRRF
jgi:phytoene dehydrogenase-like protein